ncbi:MAG: hypothetical protein Q9163_006292 [Psora crenata]
MAVPNETFSSMTRTTRDGRQLQYRMEVVQQPERARACGAGAKSSADRRPVDPPPIVELRILECFGEEKRDITFAHNANFFLYTTLEHARPMNQGRVAVSPHTLPVLTGTPVAGMAYLDRPKPAGYFIFPDLSVRHEGKYRLSFNLYEELKEPEKDADVGAPEGSPTTRERHLASNPTGPRNFVHFRLEVRSGPFAVFSAKKFPGLAESTAMSRLVNEQGPRTPPPTHLPTASRRPTICRTVPAPSAMSASTRRVLMAPTVDHLSMKWATTSNPAIRSNPLPNRPRRPSTLTPPI